MVESPHLVKPGKKFNLKSISPSDTDGVKGKKAAEHAAKKSIKVIKDLQEVLYAQNKHKILIVLQATDAGGKDGTIEHIFGGVNPQGCEVTSFKAPSTLERSHDFLWRHHLAVPRCGMIGIFNRSHYEAVLVERVRELVPKDVWQKRYESINNFEKMLAEEGMTILKFFLHISKKEQAERLQDRLDEPDKNWKFNPGDLEERQHWDGYQAAYNDMLERCSTESAPWYVVPSDKKWYRNFVVSDILARAMQSLDLKFPEPLVDVSKYKIA